MKFQYLGEIYPEPPTFMMSEILHIEKLFDKHLEDFSQTDQVMANAYLGIRRVNPKLLPWEKFSTLGLGTDIETIFEKDEKPDGEPEYEPDPTEAVSRTAPLDWLESPESAEKSAQPLSDGGSI